MEKLDWSRFTKRISINKQQKDIYEFFLTQENFEKWFLSKAVFVNRSGDKKEKHIKIEKGDKYVWMWYGSDNIAEGEILELNYQNNVKFTFLDCIVEMTIKTEENENVVELVQSEIPLDEDSRMNYFVGCSRGWTFYLSNLKSILEGGIDLRNRNKKLTNVINT